jgi:hypothetical protein
MAGNSNYTVLLSTTLNNYRDTLTDNIFKNRPLTTFLMDRTRMEDGCVKIIEPLIYAQGQAASYSGYDQITITPQGGLSAAEYDWRQLYATIAISGIEEAQNNGKSAIIKLLEAKIMQAEETLKDNVNAMLYGDGTGNSSKEWLGLAALIGGLDAGGTGAYVGTTTVGNINGNSGTDAYWNSKVYGSAAGTATELTLQTLATPYNAASKGNDKPDAMFTTQSLFEGYEALLLPSVRRSDTKSADAGFDNLLYKGKPIFWDADCTAGTVYGLNSKYITLVGHKDRWFKNSGFTDNTASSHATSGASVITDARYALITSYGNLTVRNRARHFRCTNYVSAL